MAEWKGEFSCDTFGTFRRYSYCWEPSPPHFRFWRSRALFGSFTPLEQITPGRLTQILRQVGQLERGCVSAVKVMDDPAFNSAISRLAITYSSGSSPAPPAALVLKRNLPEQWARDAGRAEVEFYLEVRAMRDELAMIVPCYEAVYDPSTGDSHLLLLDVSETHEPLVARSDLITMHGVPAVECLQSAVQAVSQIHACWWEHPSLLDGSRQVSDWYGTQEHFNNRIEQRRGEWEIFQALAGENLPADLRALYRQVLDRLPILWDHGLGERISSGRNLTLVHGDCYLSQFLYPRDGEGPTYLVDWQDCLTDLPSLDLAHLFASFWTREQRHDNDRERRLLRCYLDALGSAGVADYTWEQLQWDYQLLLIYMVLLPVWDAVNGSSKDYWWPKMQCLTAAYCDWACAELLT